MQVHSFTVGPFAENTYLLTEGNEAIIIDPGFSEASELESVVSKIRNEELKLIAVILTHAHVDHALGLSKLLDAFDVPVYLSDKDRYLWNNFASQAAMFGFQVSKFDFEPKNIPLSDNWEIGNFSFDVRYTPGHAPDHISLYNAQNGFVIAGDALFKEGIGRTDLYKGDMQTLKESIQKKLYSLPDDTTVYPGHGPETSIGHEKESNPFVRG